jgi:regulator of replication initiation timing
MTDIFEDIFDEADALGSVDTQTGSQLSQLVRNLRNVEQQIEDAENHLKALKAEKHRLSVENIPQLMDEMGVERLDVDGVTVERKMIVSASIPAARKDEAFSWLRDNGLDDIIKNDVTCSFGKGEDNVAGDVVGLLQERGFDPKTKTHVHPSTLKAFVKERVTDGKPIDLDMFGAFISNAAQIRRKA